MAQLGNVSTLWFLHTRALPALPVGIHISKYSDHVWGSNPVVAPWHSC